MILYTVTGAVGSEGYLDISKSGDLTGKNIYVNMTNKCPCNCVFCLRHTKELLEGNDLWLKEGEPDVDHVLQLFSQYDLSVINELVFCGFGEPLERLEDVCAVIDALKQKYPELMMAALISCVPMIVIYIFFQKQFIEGIATSGGKL